MEASVGGLIGGDYLQISSDLPTTSLSSISRDLNLSALAPNHPFRTTVAARNGMQSIEKQSKGQFRRLSLCLVWTQIPEFF